MPSPLQQLYRRLKKSVRFAWRTKSLCRVFCVLFGHCYAPFWNAPEHCLCCERTRGKSHTFRLKGIS